MFMCFFSFSWTRNPKQEINFADFFGLRKKISFGEFLKSDMP